MKVLKKGFPRGTWGSALEEALRGMGSDRPPTLSPCGPILQMGKPRPTGAVGGTEMGLQTPGPSGPCRVGPPHF